MDLDQFLVHSRTRSLEAQLDLPGVAVRLEALRTLTGLVRELGVQPQASEEVNNHVHTVYSFSPYTPAKAVWQAWKSGLQAVGTMDHDSVGAAGETIQAGRILGLATTVGCELRVTLDGTPLAGRKLNNPDGPGLAYMAIHGIPHDRLEEMDAFIAPLRKVRSLRNRRQVEGLNHLLGGYGLPALSWEADVLPLAFLDQGGTMTERHILLALARMLSTRFGKGPQLLAWLESGGPEGPLGGRALDPLLRARLEDSTNPHHDYDLLGLLKASFLPRFWLAPEPEECLPVAEVCGFAQSIGAIPAYAYLGDVAASPTGDKKAEAFEDAFLEELLALLPRLGFEALTYMPPRNTLKQLMRLSALCRHHGLMEISGVDINSSRQSFNCPQVLQKEFRHLIDNTWALVAHEELASLDPRLGLFAKDNPLAGLPLKLRLELWASLGRLGQKTLSTALGHNPGLFDGPTLERLLRQLAESAPSHLHNTQGEAHES